MCCVFPVMPGFLKYHLFEDWMNRGLHTGVGFNKVNIYDKKKKRDCAWSSTALLCSNLSLWLGENYLA